MSSTTKTICDNCGKEKQETNHWFGIVLNYDAAHDDGKTYAIAVTQHTLAVTDKDWRHVGDACGQACAQEMVSRYLSTGKVLK